MQLGFYPASCLLSTRGLWAATNCNVVHSVAGRAMVFCSRQNRRVLDNFHKDCGEKQARLLACVHAALPPGTATSLR